MSYIDDREEVTNKLSVVDVYDIASEIGKEFGNVIETHGVEIVSGVLPKVITALEHLEILAAKNERENNAIEDLNGKINRLELEKIEKAEDRQRFETELEQIEEHWREETKELLSMVSRLQDENRKLVAAVQRVPDQQSANSVNEVDMAVLQRLRTMIDKQREQIRLKDKELSIKISELETMSGQVDRLTTTSRELRRKHKMTQSQIRTLIDERAEFLAEIQDKQRNIAGLNQRLGLVQKENEDLSITCQETPNLKNKAIFDLDDPNRPRFTTRELKDILQERNELKARVNDLEDELENYRPRKKEAAKALGCTETSPEDLNTNREREVKTRVRPHNGAAAFPLAAMDAFFRFQPHFPHSPKLEEPSWDEMEDAPVQGPLPYEPDDAPWKKSESESGIRKFFRKLFSESNVSLAGPGPRRSLSTLSKMALATTSNDTSV